MIKKPNEEQHRQKIDGVTNKSAVSRQEDLPLIERLMGGLTRYGLGELATRLGANAFSILFILAVSWLMQALYGPNTQAHSADNNPDIGPTPIPILYVSSIPIDTQGNLDSIYREISLHTIIPSRPRVDVIQYTVVAGDTLFGIADKFGLKASTLLYGNYETLKDTPHSLRVGQVLTILPVDGTYYEWQGIESLKDVAQSFGVEPEAIVNFAGNHLDPDAITDFDNPNIPEGTWLVIPGGKRELLSWQAPIGVTRDHPATALKIGPGACGAISGGAVGFGYFLWPTDHHYLSGYDWSPDTGHKGIDLDGDLGSPIYAADAGVIVYAGLNNYGYGNMIMIDHGNDWQTLYAHLEDGGILVSCGQSVGMGEQIGLMGSTGNSSGPHLHFEILNTIYGAVNPHDYLPEP